MTALNLKLNLKIDNLLPCVIFIAAAAGVALASFLKAFFIFLFLAVFALIFAFIFGKRGKTLLSDGCIFMAALFSFSLWGADSYFKSIGDFAGKEHNFTFTVIALPREAVHCNLLQGEISNISGVAIKAQVTIVDYTKTLQYLKKYCATAKAGVIERNNRPHAYLWVKKDSNLTSAPEGVVLPLSRAFNLYVLQKFKENFHDTEARFLGSLFLGRYELLKKERQFFIDAGVSHLLAISGLHMTLVSAVLFFIFGLLYCPYRLRLVLAGICIYAYGIFSGANPSAMRAAWMCLAFAVTFFLRKKADLLNAMGLAGLISLLIDPKALFDIGFELSYLSVFALIIGAKIFPMDKGPGKVTGFLKESLFISFWVSLLILPLTAYYFERIYPDAIIFNLFLVPFCNLILLMVFVFLVLSPCAILASPLAAVLGILSRWFVELNRLCSITPGAFLPCKLDTSGVIIYYIILAALVVYLSKSIIKNDAQ